MLLVIYLITLSYLLINMDIKNDMDADRYMNMNSVTNATILASMLCLYIMAYIGYYINKVKCSLVSKVGYVLLTIFANSILWVYLTNFDIKNKSIADMLVASFYVSCSALTLVYIKLLINYRISEQDSYILPYYVDRKER